MESYSLVGSNDQPKLLLPVNQLVLEVRRVVVLTFPCPFLRCVIITRRRRVLPTSCVTIAVE
jgi:hypothetical protein